MTLYTSTLGDYMDVEQIKKRIEIIDKINDDVKKAKEMLKSALDNDSAYQQAAEENKVAASKKKQMRDEVYNLPEHRKVVEQIKDSNEEIGALKEILAEELIEYRQASKTESIQDKDGQTRYFKLSCKLVNKQGEES